MPKNSPPLIQSKKSCLIPKTIWQTNFTDRVSLPVYLNYLFNRLFSPTYAYRFMTTEDCNQFIGTCGEKIHEAYNKLQIGAAQADLWRLLVLYKYGGVYIDVDAHFMWPLECTIPDDSPELYIKKKEGHVSNYFIASGKNNLNMKLLIDKVLLNIEQRSSKNVYDLTGPGVLNDILDLNLIPTAYYRYSCIQGTFTNDYFQYIDRPDDKWTRKQKKISIIKE